jgi:hypothetical protein
MANSKLDKLAINTLIESICEEHGLEEQTEFNFEDFCQILSPQMDKLYNAGLDWKGLYYVTKNKCLNTCCKRLLVNLGKSCHHHVYTSK